MRETWLCLLFVSACAGDSEDKSDTDDTASTVDTTPNQAPVAALAPVDAFIFRDTTLTFDGRGSTDPDEGDELTWIWSIEERPPGSKEELSANDTPTVTLTPNALGPWRVRMRVTDGELLGSTEASFTVVVDNLQPVANGGPDQVVDIGDTVQLDGKASTDGDGDELTYLWSVVGAPPGASSVALDGATTATPSFVAAKAGIYTVELIVNDGQLDSRPDYVSVSVHD